MLLGVAEVEKFPTASSPEPMRLPALASALVP